MKRNTKNGINVTVNIQRPTLTLLRRASRVNNCTLQAATQFLLDYGQGNLCDWSNEGFPMFNIKEEAKRGFAQLQTIGG
jgi:hypothetical protein